MALLDPALARILHVKDEISLSRRVTGADKDFKASCLIVLLEMVVILNCMRSRALLALIKLRKTNGSFCVKPSLRGS